jgi:protein-disulfide isomerase
MTFAPKTLLPAVVAFAVIALGGCRTSAGAAPGAAAPGVAAPAPSAADPAAVLPGVELEGLSPEQQRVVAEYALQEFCPCGCPHTVSSCLRTHQGCKHGPRTARLAVRLARAGAGTADLRRFVNEYHASFDRRVRLDLTDFGPPLGKAEAPVTIVEFSDFTCPFCRGLRPTLEAFVTARADRVKLLYKPFPIEAHPGAAEAAEAVEWARDQGIFWPMHDALFVSPGHSLDQLAALARELGGDPGDLRDAVQGRRHADRIRASMSEGRAAGMRGTPTLFMNGRLLTLPDYSEETLEMALQDEEEWQAHHGWERD